MFFAKFSKPKKKTTSGTPEIRPLLVLDQSQFLNLSHINGANKNQQQESYQRETIPDKFVFFFFQN